MTTTLLITSLAAYFMSSVFYLINLHIRRRRLALYGTLLAATGFLVQTVRLFHMPLFASASEAIFFLSWAFTALYLAILLWFRLPAIGAIAMPLVTISLAFIYTLPTGHNLASDRWLKVHIITIIASFALFTLAFCCAIFYQIQNKLLKSKKLKGMYRRLPALETLDSLGFHLTAIGFPLLSLALVTGVIGVRSASVQAYKAEIRLALSGLAWIIYGAYLLAHSKTSWRGKKANSILIIGAILIASITALHKFA